MLSPNKENVPVCYAEGVEPHMYHFLDPTTMHGLDYEPIKASQPLPWTNSVLPTFSEVTVLCKVDLMDVLPKNVVSMIRQEKSRLGHLQSSHYYQRDIFKGYARMGWRERRRMEKEWKSSRGRF